MLLKNPPPCLDPEREVPWQDFPFTNQEAAGVQECLRNIANKNGKNPTKTVDRWWPVVREAAEICALNLSFDALRSNDPNHMRPMRRSLKKVQETGTLPKDFKHSDALEYGARRAGLNGDLNHLTPQELSVAARAALAHGPINSTPPGNTRNILYNTSGRPSMTLRCKRQPYPKILVHIYRRITSEPPSFSTSWDDKYIRSGPAVYFLMACLAPVHPNPTPDAVVEFIKKRKKKRKKSG